MTSAFQIAGPLTTEDVADVRRFVEKVHRRRVANIEDVSRLAMTAHELLDNAIKFSVDGTASLTIEMIDGRVHVRTRNRARTSDLAGLQRIATGLQAARDPMKYYVELMTENPEARGGLGLGRIVAEGDMQLELTLDGDIVEVHAHSALTA